MIGAKTIKIGTDVFEIGPMPAMRAFLLQPDIGPAFAELCGLIATAAAAGGPSLMSKVQAAEDPKAEGEKAGESIIATLEIDKLIDVVPLLVGAIGRFFERVPRARLELITKELLFATTMNGQLLFTPQGNPFDVALQGRAMVTWKLLIAALSVNFPDFFGGLDALGALLKRRDRSEKSST